MKITYLAATLSGLVLFSAAPAFADAGEKIYKKKCKSCHTLEAGKHKTGPSLASIVGRPAGKQDFKNYKGLVDADFVWTEENLDGWLTNPKKFIGKRSAMNVKLKKPKDRAAVIEFLKQH